MVHGVDDVVVAPQPRGGHVPDVHAHAGASQGPLRSDGRLPGRQPLQPERDQGPIAKATAQVGSDPAQHLGGELRANTTRYERCPDRRPDGDLWWYGRYGRSVVGADSPPVARL